MIIFDRLEAEFAVLETDDGTVTVPRTALPPDANVGDALVRTPDGGYSVDRDATKARRKKLSERFRRLQRK